MDRHFPACFRLPRCLFDCVKEDIFLENFIISECLMAGIKYVQMPQFHLPQEELSKLSEIAAVAKTTRRNRRHFAAQFQQSHRDSQEARVEVAGFNSQI